VIETIINEPVALTSNTSPVVFDETDIRTRCASCCGWLDYQNGNPNFKIFGNGYTGYYDVEFSASISSATAGVVAIGLYSDGVLIPDTVRAVTLATAGDYETIAFDKKIRVCPRGTTNITVGSVPSVPTPTDVTTPIVTQIPIVTNATFSIDRLDR
jgi:hypothetical protein